MRLSVDSTPVMSEAQAQRAFDPGLADVPPDQQAAARYADILMTTPGDIPDDLVAELHRHFDRRQIVELTLKIMKFNMQKVTVAAGHDRWITPETFDATGFGYNGWFVAAPPHVD